MQTHTIRLIATKIVEKQNVQAQAAGIAQELRTKAIAIKMKAGDAGRDGTLTEAEQRNYDYFYKIAETFDLVIQKDNDLIDLYEMRLTETTEFLNHALEPFKKLNELEQRIDSIVYPQKVEAKPKPSGLRTTPKVATATA